MSISLRPAFSCVPLMGMEASAQSPWLPRRMMASALQGGKKPVAGLAMLLGAPPDDTVTLAVLTTPLMLTMTAQE